jgi:hypothetical protein
MGFLGGLIASFVALLLGAIIAGVTLVGLVSSQVNSSGDHTADINNPVIDYGTTSS